jgi:hypothetical protein
LIAMCNLWAGVAKQDWEDQNDMNGHRGSWQKSLPAKRASMISGGKIPVCGPDLMANRTLNKQFAYRVDASETNWTRLPGHQHSYRLHTTETDSLEKLVVRIECQSSPRIPPDW